MISASWRCASLSGTLAAAIIVLASGPAPAQDARCDGLASEAEAATELREFFDTMLQACEAAEIEMATTGDHAFLASAADLMDRLGAYREAVAGVGHPTEVTETSRYLIAAQIGVMDSMRDWVLTHRQASGTDEAQKRPPRDS